MQIRVSTTSANITGIVRSVLKERGQHGKREKDKNMTLETLGNLAKSDKVSFDNQREWLEEYEYGKGMFYSEYVDNKNYTSSEDNNSNWEESSSEDDKSSDSNTEELPVEDKNIVVSLLILRRLICSSVVCKDCHESVSLIEDQQYSAGLARRFKIQCTSTNCQPKNLKPFSDMTRKSGQFYEINRAFTLACRLIGRGYSAATKITSVLNLDRPASTKTWKKTYTFIDLICRTASNSKYE